MKKVIAAILLAALLGGCAMPQIPADTAGGVAVFPPAQADERVGDLVAVQDLFSNRDRKTEYESDGTITLQGSTAESDAENVTISGSTITITLAGSGDHAVQMLSKVVCRAYAVAEEENVAYCQVSWDTVKAAENAGLCIPRYLAWQELRRTDPNITVEDIREMPIEQIRRIIYVDTLENPCGE